MPNVSLPVPNMVGGVSQQAISIRENDECEESLNAWPSPVYGLKKRAPFDVMAQILSSEPHSYKFHIIDRDDERYLLAILRDTAISTPYYKVFDLLDDGAEMEVFKSDSSTSYNYLITSNFREKLSLYSVGDQTFCANAAYLASMDSGTSASPANTGEGYIFVRAGGLQVTYGVRIDDGTNDNTFEFDTDSIDTDETPAIPVPGGTLENQRTDQLAEQLRLGINAMTGTWTATRDGNCVKVTHSSAFTDFEVTDSVGDTYLIAFKDGGEVPRVEGYLPLVCTHGVKVKVVGDAETDGDEYWVGFVADGGSGVFGPGHWEETIGYDVVNSIDPDSMPHRFARYVDDGTGPTVGGNGTRYFEFERISWDDMIAGDSTTNPNPEFIGRAIRDVIYWKDRLCLIADQSISFSEAGEYFNFFRSTLLTLPDSAPISVEVNSYPPAYLRRAIIFNESLVATSDFAQFIVRGTDILSPRTIEVVEASRYEVTNIYRPLTGGRSLFMPFKRGSFAGVYELYQRGDTAALDEQDITAKISSYIDGEIDHMAISTTEDTLIVRASDHSTADNSLYVYRYLWSGSEKVMSCWGRWNVPSGYTAEWFDFIENRLYVVLHSQDIADGIWLVYADLGDRETTGSLDFDILCDMRRHRTDCTSVSYSATNPDYTTIMPGYTIDNLTQEFVVVNADTGKIIPFEPTHIAGDGATTWWVQGDQTAVNFYIGVRYKMEYTFSKPLFKIGGHHAAPTRNYVRHLWLNVHDSDAFAVKVTNGARSQKTWTPNGTYPEVGGSDSVEETTDAFRIPMLGEAKDLVVVFENDEPHPSNLVSAEWETVVRSRSRRQQA